ncbi:ensconsin isoform X5 [Perca fluviatilis]|uniref:ensconsin isoform X5 n=1 Tax=Perca fluviatilis TaxID=8168 RepID=UPI0019642A89|nr:ensconsin isoform X5 [Perca fluviatilis]
MAVQKKHCDIPPSQGPLSTRTIESQKKRNGFERTGDNGGYIKPNSQAKKAACSVNKAAEICNTATPRATAAVTTKYHFAHVVANGLNVDERLKAARERRQEHQKLLVFREQGRLEREQRARRYYEQQLQERKKKLQDQRLREERKRAAVEEKRKQRLKEEKERYESAVRRTVEKSQKVQQSLSQYSRGRKLTKNISFHSMNSTTTTTTTTTPPHKPQHHSGSAHHWPSASPRPNNSQHRSINLAQITTARQQDTNKKNSNTRSPAVNTSLKPAKDTQSRTTSPSPKRTLRRSVSRHSTPLQLELPPVPEEDGALCSSALSPGNSRPVRTSQMKMRDENPPEAPCSNLPDKKSAATTRTAAGYRSPPQTPPHPAPQPPEVTCRPSAGTSDPGEASRLLAEKRREARLQREREEQERLQREEAERRSREELERKRADERARQQAEAQRLIEEKMRREEEEQRKAEEERAQAMREATLLQKQREEEQAREKEKAEQMKQEREILAQKEEAARQARKKRLEEIMRRTRRTDSPDTKSVPVKILPNEAQPKENTEPVHNGTIEDVVKLPVGTKTSQLGLNNEEDMVPVVAFKERRSLRTLTGLEEIQTHQRAEVI